jgi:hypothetical protein
MKKNIPVLIFYSAFFLSFCTSYAQVQMEWMKRFSAAAAHIDRAKFIAVDDSANVVVAGISETNVSNRGEMCVTKYNARGDSLWTSVFEEPGSFNSDEVNGLAIDNDQDIVITGYTHKPPDRDDDLFITTIKYNHLSGEQMFFERNLNPDPNASDRANDIATFNNYVFITGEIWGGTLNSGGTGYDMVVFSYMPDGANSMVYHWQDSSAAVGTSIGVNQNGQVYALGYGSKDGKTSLRLVTVGGNFTSYVLPDTDWGMASLPKMLIDSEGNQVIITQFMGNASGLGNKLLLLKYNSGNQPAWTQIINSSISANTVFYDMAVDTSSNIIIAGGFRLSNGSYKNFIEKFSPGGDSLWTVFPPAVTYKLACAIATDKQNSVYISGNLNGMIAIKFDQNGQETWRAGEGIQYWQSDIAVDTLFNVYVTGERWIDWPGDYCTVKYSQANSNGITDLKPGCDFQLFQNHPNPCSENTTVAWQLTEKAYVTLKVFNLTGQEVKTLVDCDQAKGEHKVNFNVSGLPDGIYVCQLQAGRRVEKKKIIVCR